jgi:hypothetical protein
VVVGPESGALADGCAKADPANVRMKIESTNGGDMRRRVVGIRPSSQAKTGDE